MEYSLTIERDPDGTFAATIAPENLPEGALVAHGETAAAAASQAVADAIGDSEEQDAFDRRRNDR